MKKSNSAFITAYERDIEADLDFSQARYYKYQHGRFTSVDPILSSAVPNDPQTWNRYAYALNNPHFYIDPTGMYVCTGTKEQCQKFEDFLTKAREKLDKIKRDYEEKSDEYTKSKRALDAYGEAGKDNNVFVSFRKGGGAQVDLTGKENASKVKVVFGEDTFSSDFGQALIGNEGSNIADAQDFIKTDKSISEYQGEFDSLFVQAVIGEQVSKEKGLIDYGVPTTDSKGKSKRTELWKESWEKADINTLRANRTNGINEHLKNDADYELTPTNAKGKAPMFRIVKPKRSKR